MSPNQIHIPYVDDLLVIWHDTPGAHALKQINHFDIAILLLCSHAIHIDKTEHWFETKFLKKFYSRLFDSSFSNDALQFVRLNLTRELAVFKLCTEISEVSTEKVRIQLLFYFFDLAVSDGKLHNEELKFIEAIKDSFQISNKQYQSIFSLYAMYNKNFRREALKSSDNNLNLALKVFGLTATSNLEQVKKKYKQLVKLHHPDKVTHLGKIHYDRATKMIKEINKAYSYIEKHFNI